MPSQVAQSLLTNRDTTPPLERIAVSNGQGATAKARCRTRRLSCNAGARGHHMITLTRRHLERASHKLREPIRAP
ncbi:hypothetical protein HMPREF9602_01071 [Cutibacterium acnes HL030PA2]|nr:hypothetical protein HMPREF9602_01071 [Cutibacterium acnes HL030PA2]